MQTYPCKCTGDQKFSADRKIQFEKFTRHRANESRNPTGRIQSRIEDSDDLWSDAGL